MKNPTSLRRTHRAAALAGLAGAVAAGALLPLPARAEVVLSYGDMLIDTQAKAQLVGSTEIVLPQARLPNGDPTKAEVFVTPGVTSGPNWYWGGFEYGTPTNHPEQAYASTQMNGGGHAELGVSGRSEGPNADAWGRLTADIFAQQRVTNVGGAGTVKLDYTIPLIEIANYGTRYEGLVANVGAFLLISRFNSQGSLIEDLPGFRYQLDYRYEKPPTTYAIETYTASEELLRDSGGLVDVTEGCSGVQSRCGRAIEPFSVSRTIGELDAGDYLEYTYVMSAYLVTGREGGGHALYGDPFAFSGGDGRNFFEFSAAEGSVGSVPEPGSWALFGTGVALLAWRRRGRGGAFDRA